MPPDRLLETLRHAAAATSLIEWLAVAFGLIQVLLARGGSIWNYAAGILSTGLTIWLMADAQLYAEAVLNLYYFLISIWGIYAWRQQSDGQSIPQFATRREWIVVTAIAGLGTVSIAFLLATFTPSDVPLWDGAVSALAWAGTWLLTRRRVENWLVLNVSNLLAIPLQVHKGLYLYALLTIVLFIIALDGYRLWRNQARSVRKNGLPG
ncbi:MAG: nicotinamide riboside transporter PnuC [Sphingobacteriales bacterium]|nr:MAG: nicotinamide riboside transporter PnuC [Sphingobacteriales bacterium]